MRNGNYEGECWVEGQSRRAELTKKTIEVEGTKDWKTHQINLRFNSKYCWTIGTIWKFRSRDQDQRNWRQGKRKGTLRSDSKAWEEIFSKGESLHGNLQWIEGFESWVLEN